jgi:excisionase family DNA binding protein
MTKCETTPPSRLLTIQEVADYLRNDPKSVRRLIKSKQLAAYKVGRQWRVAEGDLRAFLAKRWHGE